MGGRERKRNGVRQEEREGGWVAGRLRQRERSRLDEGRERERERERKGGMERE